ncbi:unnamed protein product (macronuclear) [Paramecium tetraurelia]|uniref:Sulfite exporter TauE/SafE n=1 Tax=Paramecium tetraurelia TaxID=5888 RepID=A0CFC0_PARTE|nr:uncharacterized protein GSPATT00037926001 [Paramecium tetraurelia]CAK69487.1 unnamed protein product [Paramecium tetraurelia]|eukprot:XP_001436884.1 hypothetical protein (macronuclear) [Paramecium tetraurelia strain d4-2]
MFKQVCPESLNCGYLNKCINGMCIHDPIFPMSLYATLVYILCPVLLGLGMTGGLGGGVLKGPILLMMLDYEQSYATQLSYCLMFGGCVINTFLLMKKSHPYDQKRPLVNYDLVVILNCSIALGSYLGSILNVFLAPIIETMFQQIFLIIVIPFLLNKAKKEKLRKIRCQSELDLEKYLLNQKDSIYTEEQQLLLQNEFQNFCPSKKLAIALSFFIVSQIIMTGGKYLKPFIPLNKCFDFRYMLWIMLFIVNIFMSRLVYTYGLKKEMIFDDYKIYMQERYFQKNRFILIYVSGFFAGLISGLLALGAGLIMVPVLLELGLHPRIATATSAFNYFFIGLTNIVKLITDSQISIAEIAWFFGLALVFGTICCHFSLKLIEKLQLVHLVIYFTILLAILNFIAGIYYPIVQSLRFGFTSLLQFEFHC